MLTEGSLTPSTLISFAGTAKRYSALPVGQISLSKR
jgi:hypothetical protein